MMMRETPSVGHWAAQDRQGTHLIAPGKGERRGSDDMYKAQEHRTDIGKGGITPARGVRAWVDGMFGETLTSRPTKATCNQNWT